MLKNAYITRLSHFLPNDPVGNEEMEELLGRISGKSSKAKELVLRNNGIKNRHYALDRNGNVTHRNAEMTAKAIRNLFQEDPEGYEEVDLLATGTTVPDQPLPSHTSMVHGELGAHPLEIISPAGSCCAGTNAMKYAWLALRSGDKRKAVCSGSERLSALLTADRFEKEVERLEELSKDPYIAFEKDFLRWMLSDGSAALLMEDEPSPSGISLRIEWMEGRSYANELEACMYYGAEKQEDGSLKGWTEMNAEDWLENSAFTIKQDVKLLRPSIVPYGGKLLKELFDEHELTPDAIDHFLPHLSSEFFRSRIEEETEKLGIHIPQEKWFTNLSKVGNVGSASPYFMLDELFHSGNLKDGQKILIMVPESARFSYLFALLTVVEQ